MFGRNQLLLKIKLNYLMKRNISIYTQSIPTIDLNDSNFILIENFINEEEEKLCIDYVNNKLKLQRYQS